MPKKPATPICLDAALREDRPVVLHLPESAVSLATLFEDEDINLTNARMTSFDDWEKPKRQNGKIYGNVRTNNMNDFDAKLGRMRNVNKIQKLQIEYAGFVTNYNNALLRQSQDMLITRFNQGAGGDLLYNDKDKAIFFPRIAHDKEKGSHIVVPYIDKSNPDILQLKEMEYEGGENDISAEISRVDDKPVYADHKSAAAMDDTYLPE